MRIGRFIELVRITFRMRKTSTDKILLSTSPWEAIKICWLLSEKSLYAKIQEIRKLWVELEQRTEIEIKEIL